MSDSNAKVLRQTRDESIRRLVSQGLTNTEIARRVGVTDHTVAKRLREMGISRSTSPSHPKRKVWTCDECRKWGGQVHRLQGHVQALAGQMSRAKNGPRPVDLERIAKWKAEITYAKSWLEEHNCEGE